MVEAYAIGYTLSAAYHDALYKLFECGKWSDCGDWNTKQLECGMTMVVIHPLQEPMISKFFIGGPRELQQYVMEMLDGILDFEVEKGNWAYTYHQRYADQLQFVIDELKRNPSSRRAVMTVRDKKADMGSDDPACLQLIQYFIRDGKLDCTVVFRSNDAVKATFMNAFALIMLQKSIADSLGIEVGTYTHRANSFHCYEKDYSRLRQFYSRYNNREDLEYDYADGWKEEMEECIPDILADVERLKRR